MGEKPPISSCSVDLPGSVWILRHRVRSGTIPRQFASPSLDSLSGRRGRDFGGPLQRNESGPDPVGNLRRNSCLTGKLVPIPNGFRHRSGNFDHLVFSDLEFFSDPDDVFEGGIYGFSGKGGSSSTTGTMPSPSCSPNSGLIPAEMRPLPPSSDNVHGNRPDISVL